MSEENIVISNPGRIKMFCKHIWSFLVIKKMCKNLCAKKKFWTITLLSPNRCVGALRALERSAEASWSSDFCCLHKIIEIMSNLDKTGGILESSLRSCHHNFKWKYFQKALNTCKYIEWYCGTKSTLLVSQEFVHQSSASYQNWRLKE